MDHAKSFRSAWRLMKALSAVAMWAIVAPPVAQATVLGELRIGNEPATGGNLGLGSGAAEQVMQGLPTTRASVEGDLSSGILRAVALTDYFRNSSDPFGYTDSYTSAGAQVIMGDQVSFSNVPIGAVAQLDVLVTGSFSTVSNPRRIPLGNAAVHMTVTTGAPGSVIASTGRTRYFAADANSAQAYTSDQRNRLSVGTSAVYFDTVTFDLLPTTYQFSWQLNVDGLGYDVDFGSTAKTYLRLPQGVTYTSASGVFLATAQPLSPVPWPPMWQLTLAGLGLLAVRARRARPS